MARLVELTTQQSTPAATTNCSTRKVAAERGVSAASVSRHWPANGLEPHLLRGYKVSRDAKFVEKLEDIVGLCMSPPEHALMLCGDEKSQVQALDRTQPGVPLKKRRAATRTHDYKRSGTTALRMAARDRGLTRGDQLTAAGAATRAPRPGCADAWRTNKKPRRSGVLSTA